MTCAQTIVFATLILAAQSYGQPAGNLPTALVTVIVVDSAGNAFTSPGVLKIKNEASGAVLSKELSDRLSLRLPYGNYSFVFEASYTPTLRQQVAINTSSDVVVFTARFEMMSFVPGEDMVSLSISTVPATSCLTGGLLMGKIFSVFGQYSKVRLIQPAGSVGVALFEPIQVGKYVAAIMDGNIIRAVQAITVAGPLTNVKILFSCKTIGEQ